LIELAFDSLVESDNLNLKGWHVVAKLDKDMQQNSYIWSGMTDTDKR